MKTLRTLLLLTTAVLLCSISARAHDFEVDGIYYNVTSESELTVEVTFKGVHFAQFKEYKGDIVIPEKVEFNGKKYNVTGIAENTFYNYIELKSITIPKSVKDIHNRAFNYSI